MLKNFIIIRHLTLFIIPYILLYGLYIQVNGEVSPGGGFQSGVIFASAIIAFDLIHGKFKLKEYFCIESLITFAIIGVLIYTITGMVSILFSDNYLNYSSILSNKIAAQHLGIFVIELGVGLCVASVMSLIYIVMSKIED